MTLSRSLPSFCFLILPNICRIFSEARSASTNSNLDSEVILFVLWQAISAASNFLPATMQFGHTFTKANSNGPAHSTKGKQLAAALVHVTALAFSIALFSPCNPRPIAAKPSSSADCSIPTVTPARNGKSTYVPQNSQHVKILSPRALIYQYPLPGSVDLRPLRSVLSAIPNEAPNHQSHANVSLEKCAWKWWLNSLQKISHNMDSQKTTISRYNNLSSRYSENIAFALTKFLRKRVNSYT